MVLGLGSSSRFPELAPSFSEPLLDSSSEENKRTKDVKKRLLQISVKIESKDSKNIVSNIVTPVALYSPCVVLVVGTPTDLKIGKVFAKKNNY